MKKEDFIVGKWYKTRSNNYYKFKEFKNDYFYSSEYIYDKVWASGLVWGYLDWLLCVLEDLSEIQEYLPDNHPDKFSSVIINNNMEYLDEFFIKIGIK